MTYQIINYSDVPDPISAWNKIVADSRDAWIWVTHQEHLCRVSALMAADKFVSEKSFFLVDDTGEICGFAPLVFTRSDLFDGLQASYDRPLPWPIINENVEQKANAESFLLDELERRAIFEGAGMLSLQNSPPNAGIHLRNEFYQIIRKRGFIDSSYLAHAIEITPEALLKVRKKYRRYPRILSDKYEISIIDSKSRHNHDGLAEQYMNLHVKDSGAAHRPLETYQGQIDMVKYGESFFVVAVNRSVDQVVGMMLVYSHKNAAFYASVAVDPEFKRDQVSVLMKWKALEHFQVIGVDHYELGKAAISPSYLEQPSDKNYGISFYKDGWSRGNFKLNLRADKFYSEAALDGYCKSKFDDLKSYTARFIEKDK